jgi:hypothetical protein
MTKLWVIRSHHSQLIILSNHHIVVQNSSQFKLLHRLVTPFPFIFWSNQLKLKHVTWFHNILWFAYLLFNIFNFQSIGSATLIPSPICRISFRIPQIKTKSLIDSLLNLHCAIPTSWGIFLRELQHESRGQRDSPLWNARWCQSSSKYAILCWHEFVKCLNCA